MKILITAAYSASGISQLEKNVGEVIYKSWRENESPYSQDELIQLIKETGANALIVEHDLVTEKVIRAHPGLKFIGVCRGTPSNVDTKTASVLGIPVLYTPGRNAQAVAEIWIANVITFLRRSIEAREWLLNRSWNGGHTSWLSFEGNELAGKKIGIVGFGAIGQLIAKLTERFPCPIQFYDPYVSSAEFPAYNKVSLKELFSTSDIVSIHLPATEETNGLIGKELFDLMSPASVFVNTARASVVQREHLFKVLKEKKIRGAVLDVFYNEPPDEMDYETAEMPNVFATPHIAGTTFEVEDHHVEILNSTLLNYFLKNDLNTRTIYNHEVISS